MREVFTAASFTGKMNAMAEEAHLGRELNQVQPFG
jgi:hypothetical protein